MGENNQKILFSLPENLYVQMSPLIIESGELVQNGRTYQLRLRMKNIADAVIQSAAMDFTVYHSDSDSEGRTFAYVYSGLQAHRDESFGGDDWVLLSDPSVSSFEVRIKSILFEDKSAWKDSEMSLFPLKKPLPIESAIIGKEMQLQYRMEICSDAKYDYLEERDLWLCPCGAYNHLTEETCHRCQTKRNDILHVDLLDLMQHVRDRLAEEERQIKEQRVIKNQKAKKRNLILLIILIVLLAAAVPFGIYVKNLNDQYHAAAAQMENGDYKEAIASFEALGSFRGSDQKVQECEDTWADKADQSAEELILQGEYADALAVFTSLEDEPAISSRIEEYESERTDEIYQTALKLISDEEYEEALSAMEALDNYQDSEMQVLKCEDAIAQQNGEEVYNKVVDLAKDGSYEEAIELLNEADSSDTIEELKQDMWDLLASRTTIAAGHGLTAAIKKDGTLYATGTNAKNLKDTDVWNDLVALSSDQSTTIGLKSDGTVAAVSEDDAILADLSDWKNMMSVSVGATACYGVSENGQVVSAGDAADQVSQWTDMISVDAGWDHVVGLQKNGTVLAAGEDQDGECDVTAWEEITAVSAGKNFTVGLKSDGTVLAAGNNEYDQCNVSTWKDIVAVSAGKNHTVALKADGTVVAVGDNSCGQCDVSDWKNIVSISAGDETTVGLTKNGKIVAVGSNEKKETNVQKWKKVRKPVTAGTLEQIDEAAIQGKVGTTIEMESTAGRLEYTGYLETDDQTLILGFIYQNLDQEEKSASSSYEIECYQDGKRISVLYSYDGEAYPSLDARFENLPSGKQTIIGVPIQTESDSPIVVKVIEKDSGEEDQLMSVSLSKSSEEE